MHQRQATAESQPAARPNLLSPLRVTAALLPVLVLVQAVFAGQGLFIDTDNLNLHGIIGNVVFVIVLVQTALVLFAGFGGRIRTMLLGANVVLLALVIAQIGLGYSGRDGGQAAALHVPNGVIVFGVSIGIAMLLAEHRRAAVQRSGSGGAN